MCNNNEILQKDLHDLLEIFERKSYEAGGVETGTLEHGVMEKCRALFLLDYSLSELDNTNGALSPRYPGHIFIPEYEINHKMSNTLTSTASEEIQCSSFNGLTRPGGGSSVGGSNGFSQTDSGIQTSPVEAANLSSFSNGGGGERTGIQQYVTFAQCLHQQQQQQQEQSAHPQPASQQGNHTSLAFQTQIQPQLQYAPQQQQLQQQHRTIYEDLCDAAKIRELITMAKYARCRQRFACPVIMFRGKYICRSATISVMPETYGRKVVDFAYDCLNVGKNTMPEQRPSIDDENNDPSDESLMSHIINETPSPFSYAEVIKSDIQLLEALNVSTIVDLMVEKRKIKYFMAVSSSEKADSENHYENFNILSLPYPGCEFFKKFRDNNYIAKNLRYDWKQSFIDAAISVPKLGPAADLDICWEDYKMWDLVTITQNYLKAALKYIQEESSGLLIHCISGWDRTPLFVSLVRLSLWADGLIHQSLNALQMTYLTLAYDWYLFGHQLPDRLKRGEDIMFFCFHVLKYITEEEFSIAEHRKRTKTSSSSGSSVIVIKSDCCDDEPLKEDLILDQDSNDSFSNCSNCDMMSITDNFYSAHATANSLANSSALATTATPAAATTNFNNAINNYAITTGRSPNFKRSKTSPITVPGASAAARQRQESTSSNGSWQVVTDTGSIDSIMNCSYMFTVAQNSVDNMSVHSANNIPVINYYYGNGSNGSCCNGGGGGGSSNGSSGGGQNYGVTPSNHSNNGSVAGSNGSAGSAGNNGFISVGCNSATPREEKGLNGGGGGVGGVGCGTRTPTTLRKQRLNAVRAYFIQAYGKTIGLKFKEGSAMNLTTFIGTLF